MSNCYVYLPENLDIDSILAKNPPIHPLNPDDLKFIAGQTIEVASTKKSYWKTSDYVQLNAKALRSYVYNYSFHLEYLLHQNVLLTDNQYIVNQKSRGFKYTSTYSTFTKPVQITKFTLVKKLKNRALSKFKTSKKLEHLMKCFNHKLTIDANTAYDLLKEQYVYDISINRKNAILKYNANKLNVDKLINGNYYFNQDDNVKRLHTNLTNMWSPLRNYIKYDGMNLVSIDIKNCQPYLSTLLLNPDFYKTEKIKDLEILTFKRLYQYSSIFNTSTIDNSIIDKILHIIMLQKNAETRTGIDLYNYIDITTKGTIYEWIKEEYFKKSGITIEDRQLLKQILFIVLFTDNRFIGQKKASTKRIFKEIFPNVYKIFSLLKKKDKTLLPRLLQTMESFLILDVIIPRIRKERPHMPLFTVHDSIVCPVGNEDYINSVMMDELTKAIGHPPVLKYDYWDPANAKIKT